MIDTTKLRTQYLAAGDKNRNLTRREREFQKRVVTDFSFVELLDEVDQLRAAARAVTS